jgi:cardiolipin synthase A/B
MSISLLVDAPAFRAALEVDLSEAQHRVMLQTLSFEGDRTGRWLAACLHRCRARDRRVIVDSFNRVILGGRFVLAPSAIADARVQRGAGATERLLTRLHRRGVAVRLCSPLGRFLQRLPARNHKKSFVVDDVVYIGGLNITDHNFGWHDMMLRIHDDRVAEFMLEDLNTTWRHRPCAASASFDGLDIDISDGRSNQRMFARVFDVIDRARTDILVHTPYLMFPFVEHLARAARRGVHVTVITPAQNTIPALRSYIGNVALQHGLDLRVYGGRMSHLKAMLIDGSLLVTGSSNFDSLSYHRHQEIIAYVTRPEALSAFHDLVVVPDLACCEKTPAGRERGGPRRALGRARSWLLEARLRATSMALVAVSRP